MNCLLVPTLAYDLEMLNRLVSSVDYPIANKFIINNGAPSTREPLSALISQHQGWRVIHNFQNRGVSGSWNMAPMLFTGEQAWLIVNDDHELQPGCLERICKEADAHPESPVIYVNEFDGYDIFVWTRSGVSQFGTFDENFYPGYLEDFEYRCRLKAADAKCHHICTDSSFPLKHGKLNPTGPIYNKMLERCKPFNDAYIAAKWQMVGSDPTFKYPFDMLHYPSCAWTLNLTRRSILERYWNEFVKDTGCNAYL